MTLFSGLNKSFFKRKIYSEFIVVLHYCFFLIAGLILLLFWLHGLADSKLLILACFALLFIVSEIVLRTLFKFVLLRVYFNSKFSSKLFVITDNANYENVLKSLQSNLDWSRQICGLCKLDEENVFFDNYSHQEAILDSISREDEKSGNVSYFEILRNTGRVCSKNDLLNCLTTGNVDEVLVYTNLIYGDEELKMTISKAEEMGMRLISG